MQKGNIQKLLLYYSTNEKFKSEIKRAMDDFFNLKDGVILAIDEISEPYFNEWLIFDFKLSTGKALLEDYYDRNPLKRPLYEMQEYKDLQTNVYGLLEALRIDKGEGMEILVLHTGEKYYVKEHSATFQLKKRDLFFNRIGKVGDHWELVGSETFILGVSIDKNIKKSFYEPGKKYTPKDALELHNKSIKNYEKKEESFAKSMNGDIDEIMEKLDSQLDKCGLSEMVNAELIKKWIADINFWRTHPVHAITPMLSGLMNGEKIEDFKDLIMLVADLANNTSHFRLKGKTPNEKYEENTGGQRRFDSSIQEIGGYKSWNMASEASVLMKDGKYTQAHEKFERAFELMKKEHTTLREIYRVFANLGICYLLHGEILLGENCLKISLELNPNYDFGVLTKKRLDSGELEKQIVQYIKYIVSKSRKKDWKELKSKMDGIGDKELMDEYNNKNLESFRHYWNICSAKKYYEYLKQFKINFKTDKLTTTPVSYSR